MKYDGIYSCGHAGTVNIVGPTKDRQWKVDREFSGLCPECFKKAKQEKMEKEREEAAAKSKEMELPELTGTEKQIVWANVIRVRVIKEYEEKIESYYEHTKEKKEKGLPIDGYIYRHLQIKEGDFIESFNYALKILTDARFWIDNREKLSILLDVAKIGQEEIKKNDIPEEVKNELEEEKIKLTVRPENGKEGVAVIEKIKYTNCAYLSVKYIKDASFINIVKSLGFRWNPEYYMWEKMITEYTGCTEERAAELGNKLLQSGITVQFPDMKSKRDAISGNVCPECKQWVKLIDGKLSLIWDGRNNSLYEAAKKLPGAKWSNGAMRIPVEFYRDVQDFAEINEFRISKMAREAIEKYKEKEAGFEKAEIGTPEKMEHKDNLKRILESHGTILEDLRDGA